MTKAADMEQADGERRWRKKPVVVDATQWFRNGDHPADAREWFHTEESGDFLGEGKVVRYFRHPNVSGEKACKHCGYTMHDHGWIDTLEGGHIVCPGDWIITGVKGERYPCKPDIFAATYEPAAALRSAQPAKASWTVPCPVCDGSGELKEAVQAWDEGGPVPECPHCNDGSLDLTEFLVPAQPAQPVAPLVGYVTEGDVDFLTNPKGDATRWARIYRGKVKHGLGVSDVALYRSAPPAPSKLDEDAALEHEQP